MGTGPQWEGSCGRITAPAQALFPDSPSLCCWQRGCLGSCPSCRGSTAQQGPSQGGRRPTCSLRGRFWRSGDQLIKLRCVPVHSHSLLRQRASSVSHLPVCLTVVRAALNINVKGCLAVGVNQTTLACAYWTGLPLLHFPLAPL